MELNAMIFIFSMLSFKPSFAFTYFPLQLRQQRICLQCRRDRFDPWVRKICWRREWQSTPEFLPGEFHQQRSLVGYNPWGLKRVGHAWVINTHSSSRGSSVPLHFLPLRVIICISEVVDISPGNLDSRLWLIQLAINKVLLFAWYWFLGNSFFSFPYRCETRIKGDGTSLVVHQLRLQAPNARGRGLIPGLVRELDSSWDKEDWRSWEPQLWPGRDKLIN